MEYPNDETPKFNHPDEGKELVKIPSSVITDLFEKDIHTRKLKNGLKIGFCSFFAIAFAALISVLWFVPGGQAIAAPLTYTGISTLIAAEIGTTAVLGTGTLISIAAARGNLRLRDLFFPFEFIGEVLRGVTEICLSLISPFLPNKWLAKAYERLHKPICQEEGRITTEEQVCDGKSFGRKVLAVTRNIGVGLVTALANTGILLGRLAIKIAKLAAAVFIKAFVTNKFAEKIDNSFNKAENSMNKATCALNGLTMDKNSAVKIKKEEYYDRDAYNPLLCVKDVSLCYRLRVAQDKADELKRNIQPSIDCFQVLQQR